MFKTREHLPIFVVVTPDKSTIAYFPRAHDSYKMNVYSGAIELLGKWGQMKKLKSGLYRVSVVKYFGLPWQFYLRKF